MRISKDLRHCGFFHLDENLGGNHPVDLLQTALRESGQKELFSRALVVLPEAFNLIGGYYDETVVLDSAVESRLAVLSRKLGVCFVVGLINDRTRHNEALLIDGPTREVLSVKTLQDGSPCYEASTKMQDKIIAHRGLSLGALICMDATKGDRQEIREKQKTRHAGMLKKFGRFAEISLLCVPARFRASSPIELAKIWNQEKLSIVIGNFGPFTHPSVLHFDNGEICSAPTDRNCHLHLGAIPFLSEGRNSATMHTPAPV